ncbi:MFS transporter [Trinickia dabaoshanensis]|uniref:MFS transporter n=1 Tax=Trinickia dabaoshanensis TaxID=564714 RepID=A0A2N7VGR9_9BURK|nr:MFS transporter [Trinickia dabaoshanensis]PMS16347.1 MFS transporter [Trinickia dabaoshanensis]
MPIQTALPPSAASLPRAFHRLAWSNLAAQCAEQIGLAATPIVAVFALGAGAGQTGWLQTAQTMPFLALSIILGVWADQTSRQKLMACAEAVRCAALLAVLAALVAGQLSLPLLAVCGFIGACGTVAYKVAAPSLITALVERDAWATANGRIELARSVAYSAGPALGGLLVGVVGASAAFLAAAALSASAVFLLAKIGEPERAPALRRRFLSELREGAAFVAGNVLLRAIVATAVFFNIGFFVIQAVYVPYASRQLGLSATGVGITLAAYGAGMVVGALSAPKISRLLPFGRVLIVGPLCGLAASLTLCATLLVPSPWIAAAAYFQLGFGPILWVISSTTLRQAITPQSMLGRVSALISTATYGSRPLGALIGATLGGAAGARPCLVVAVAAFAIQALIILRSPAARLAKLPDHIE